MNPGQMAQQIAHLLRSLRWTEGDAHLVFADVHVSLGPPDPRDFPPGWAWALVAALGDTQDEEIEGLRSARFAVIFSAECAGEAFGGGAATGGSITALGRSANRGALEIASRIQTALEDLTTAAGAPLNLGAGDGVEASRGLGEDRSVAFGRVELEASCTTAPSYTGVEELAVSGSTWTWDGAAARARFDFSRFELWRKAGSSPPAYPGDGTLLGTSTVDTLSAAPPGGSYTLFATYSSRRNALREGYSTPDRGSTLRP